MILQATEIPENNSSTRHSGYGRPSIPLPKHTREGLLIKHAEMLWNMASALYYQVIFTDEFRRLAADLRSMDIQGFNFNHKKEHVLSFFQSYEKVIHSFIKQISALDTYLSATAIFSKNTRYEEGAQRIEKINKSILVRSQMIADDLKFIAPLIQGVGEDISSVKIVRKYSVRLSIFCYTGSE